ncbi:MAG: nickel-dependent hydrogenase large subunit [Herpetosiphonaceae bacterium]|nr:nickel-dependent hydrogenase large subunit [Herpetosiphonaceae bacterium]
MAYQLALGPFGTVWRGPQRISLHVDDERITEIELRDGYAARDCAVRLLRLDLRNTAPLVSRICGVHGHHHLLAWTLALEAIAGLEVPPRAQVLRLLVAEGERVASHVHAAAGVVELLGLELVHTTLLKLHEATLQGLQMLTGQRCVHEFALPGGVQHDLHSDEVRALRALLGKQERELRQVIEGLIHTRGLSTRTGGIGTLSATLMAQFAVRGVFARAAGSSTDIRRDAPYAGYDVWQPRLVQQRGGDVQSRLFIWLLESYESISLAQRLLQELPEGLWRGDPLDSLPEGSATVEVEAPTGPLRYMLRSDGVQLTEVIIDGPQLADRWLLRALLVGQAAEDGPLVIASLASCVTCAEA